MSEADEVLKALQGFTKLLGIDMPDTDAADPFEHTDPQEDMIHPEGLALRVLKQETISVHPVLDKLCITEKPGIPKGATIMLSGGPGDGKTRTIMECVLNACANDIMTMFVVTEEGYFDEHMGRDDLHSRMIKMSRRLGLDWNKLVKNLTVIQSQYFKGRTWNDFVRHYHNLVDAGVQFVVIDSFTGLDPRRNSNTVANLNAFKTVNHSNGVTGLVTSQIRETGMPAGGNATMHTADIVFHLSELTMSSKEMAKEYDLNYRDKMKIIECLKSNTTPVTPGIVRVHITEGFLRLATDHLPAEIEEDTVEPAALPGPDLGLICKTCGTNDCRHLADDLYCEKCEKYEDPGHWHCDKCGKTYSVITPDEHIGSTHCRQYDF